MGLTTSELIAIVLASIFGLLILGYLFYLIFFRKRPKITLDQVEDFIKSNPNYNDIIINYIRQTNQVKQIRKDNSSDLPGEVTVSSPKDQELNKVFKDSQTTPVR